MPQPHPEIGKIGHYEVRHYLDATTTWAIPYSWPIRSSHFCYRALWRPQYLMQSLQVQICFPTNFFQVLSKGSLGSRHWNITLFLELIVFTIEVKTSVGHSHFFCVVKFCHFAIRIVPSNMVKGTFQKKSKKNHHILRKKVMKSPRFFWGFGQISIFIFT